MTSSFLIALNGRIQIWRKHLIIDGNSLALELREFKILTACLAPKSVKSEPASTPLNLFQVVEYTCYPKYIRSVSGFLLPKFLVHVPYTEGMTKR